MTRTRPRAVATSLTFVLSGTVPLLPQQSAVAVPPPAARPADRLRTRRRWPEELLQRASEPAGGQDQGADSGQAAEAAAHQGHRDRPGHRPERHPAPPRARHRDPVLRPRPARRRQPRRSGRSRAPMGAAGSRSAAPGGRPDPGLLGGDVGPLGPSGPPVRRVDEQRASGSRRPTSAPTATSTAGCGIPGFHPRAAPLARPGAFPPPAPPATCTWKDRPQPPPPPHPDRRQHRRADGHRRQGPVPVRVAPVPTASRPTATRDCTPTRRSRADRRAAQLRRAGRTKHDTFKTRHAGIIRGLVSTAGIPLSNEFLAILDSHGDFAAGVVTDEIGRYVINSLKPGAYTVTTRSPRRPTSRSRRSSQSPRRPSPPPTWRSTPAAR